MTRNLFNHYCRYSSLRFVHGIPMILSGGGLSLKWNWVKWCSVFSAHLFILIFTLVKHIFLCTWIISFRHNQNVLIGTCPFHLHHHITQPMLAFTYYFIPSLCKSKPPLLSGQIYWDLLSVVLGVFFLHIFTMPQVLNCTPKHSSLIQYSHRHPATAYHWIQKVS